MKVDITFEDSIDDHQKSSVYYGIQSIALIRTKLAQKPLLKPIVLLIKKLLSTHKLNIPYCGGLSSFPLILMVSAFLQGTFTDPAYCFINFLYYFGHLFNNDEMVIMDDIIEALTWKQNETTIGLLPPDLFILDPFRPEVNAAKSVTNFSEIKFCFAQAYSRLLELDRSVYGCDSILENVFG